MTYQEFQQYCASYGFSYTPISWKDYEWLVSNGFDVDSIYSIACDVAAGYDIAESIQAINS